LNPRSDRTTVVNVRHAPYDIYIGRQNNRYGLPESPFHNPYRIPQDGGRTEVLDKYHAHLLSRPDLLARLPELRGKVLACWCKPYECHGDILAELADAEEGTR
jgi:hypothetical protein